MTKLAWPLSRSASASHVSVLPFSRAAVGAGGGVGSDTLVSLTYSIHALATASFGSHPALSGSPPNFAAATASVPVGGASHALSVGMATSGPPADFGSRAPRHASSHGIAR